MCNICKYFLSDFLEVGIHQELELSKSIRMSSLRKILPELTDWIYRLAQKIPSKEFDTAVATSARIARRDRKLMEYEYILHTATFNFLKFQIKWMESEIDYIKTLLIESGFVKSKLNRGNTSMAYNYISYTVPRAILVLQDLHGNHK